jgi:leukotriene-A4 hydrolase
MYGEVTHFMRSLGANVKMVTLDTRDLTIKKVYNRQTKEALSWAVYPFLYISNMANQQLVITLNKPLNYDETLQLTIEYATAPDATAVSWVAENQTFNKDLKYMYTQCEAIHCRSIVPIQDSPAVKSTFNATLLVEAPYVALASALPTKKSEILRPDGLAPILVYEFSQQVPVPSYLLALVAGHIEYKSVGRRTGVYAEPAILEKSANELVEMETFMDIVSNMSIGRRSSTS